MRVQSAMFKSATISVSNTVFTQYTKYKTTHYTTRDSIGEHLTQLPSSVTHTTHVAWKTPGAGGTPTKSDTRINYFRSSLNINAPTGERQRDLSDACALTNRISRLLSSCRFSRRAKPPAPRLRNIPHCRRRSRPVWRVPVDVGI